MMSLALYKMSFKKWGVMQALVLAVLASIISSCGGSDPLSVVNGTSTQFTEDGIDLRPILIEDYGGILERDGLQTYVGRVGKRLLDAVGRGAAPFRFMVLDSPIAQAIALPSRDMFITRGMLAVTTSESELAAVMALSMSLVHDGRRPRASC